MAFPLLTQELRNASKFTRDVKYLFVTDSIDYKRAATEYFGPNKLITTDTEPIHVAKMQLYWDGVLFRNSKLPPPGGECVIEYMPLESRTQRNVPRTYAFPSLALQNASYVRLGSGGSIRWQMYTYHQDPLGTRGPRGRTACTSASILWTHLKGCTGTGATNGTASGNGKLRLWGRGFDFEVESANKRRPIGICPASTVVYVSCLQYTAQ